MTQERTQPEANGRRPFYQRQLIIDRKFQFRLLGTLLAVWAANVIFFVIVQRFLYQGHLEAFYDVVPRNGMTPLMSFGSLVAVSVVFVSVFGANVLAMVTIYLSNQIAGPLFRTRTLLSRMADGDWNVELRFRHNDFLQELPGAFNGMVGSLRKSAEEDLREIELLEAAAGEHDEIRESVARLRARVQQRLQVNEDASPAGPPALDGPKEVAALGAR